MHIAVDAMGGDHAPEALVKGALMAEASVPATLILVGDEYRLRNVLGPTSSSSPVRVVHAPETVEMGEPGPIALRKKKKSSLSVAMRLLADGKVDAVVSAGNSAAIVATGKHFVGLLPGLRRPALGIPIPTPGGQVLLLDAGAHDQANSVHLAQCAILADVYLRATSHIPHPRLGLLNIGSEPLKGPGEVRGTYDLLERAPVHFVGNVEPHTIFEDKVDAVICDGFVGNMILKTLEGVFELFFRCRDEAEVECFGSRPPSAWEQLAERYRYDNVGGAPLLGTLRPIVVTHGRSEAGAIRNAILLASQLTENEVYRQIARKEKDNGLLYQIKHQYTSGMLVRLKEKWGLGPKTN